MAEVIGPNIAYMSRSEWGARTDLPRLGYPVDKSRRVRSIFHHTVIIDNDATPDLWETLTEVIAKMRQLQTIRPDLGLDVPYNFVIFLMADGTIIVCEGRGTALTGAHTYGHNTDGIGTALQGNFQLPINVAPYVSLISRFLGWLKYDQGLGSLGPINGHSDFSSTACPGENLYTVLGQLTYAKEDDEMVKLDNEDKLYLAGLIRGAVQAVVDGRMAESLKHGDPNWKPTRSLTEVMGAIAGIQAGSGLSYDEVVEANKEAHRQGSG